MAITTERFELALRRLDSTQWRLFERLAAVFLADEFPGLRPVSGLSGDGGADALLFRVEDDPTTIVQFSVRTDYSAKISETLNRVKKTFPDVNVLIYVTNQDVGPKSVELRRNARSAHMVHLDIRDAAWLISVRNTSTATMAEAEELAAKIVDPLVSASGSIIEQQAQALDELEAKAAFVYLGLQWKDDTREKGLTKLCFEAIVRSVLRDTTNEARRSRSVIYSLVASLLPNHHRRILETQVDGALSRLNKKYIRHWQKPDEFCLTWEERVRLAARLTELENLDQHLRAHLSDALATSIEEMGSVADVDALEPLVDTARSVIEQVLLDRGEAFAVAVTHDRGGDVRPAEIEAVINSVVTKSGVRLAVPAHVLAATLQAILVTPPDDVRRYLRSLADTYTLFAFMRETPDVQSAVVKMFSEGDIWLDTSVVLPLLAEELLQPGDRSHTELISSASECGLKLHISDGVLEELVTHVSRCRAYLRAVSGAGAHGAPPFLLNAHRLAGKLDQDFDNWIDNFSGRDPEYDLLEYLDEEHNISHDPLHEFVQAASMELRAGVSEIWHESRESREKRRIALGIPPMDTTTFEKLINHDIENYLGVVMRREARNERRSAFGYKSWWLTLDGTAFRMRDKLEQYISERPPASPAISPDFMINYLAIGPIRSRLSQRRSDTLPLMLNMSVLDAVPQDLLDLADQLRAELTGLSPRIVRRKIRETLEDAKRLMGPTSVAGELGLTDDVKARLVAAAKAR